MTVPIDDLVADLISHLSSFIANVPPLSARPLAMALLDQPSRGRLADPEFVTALVAYVGELGLWPATKGFVSYSITTSVDHPVLRPKPDTGKPEAPPSRRQLRLVQHASRAVADYRADQ